MNTPLPAELAKYSNLPDLKYRGSNEWSAAHTGCPSGPSTSRTSDRFRIFASKPGLSAGAWCRRCQHFEWADETRPTREESEESARIRLEFMQREAKRLAAKIEKLNQQAYWRGYHDAMRDTHREKWRKQGIGDNLQDYYQLGYVPERSFYNDDEEFSSPALTIPIFEAGWQVVNVQYRIVEPPAGVGKYRFTAGLPAPLYLTDPDGGVGGKCLLVEGAKKAIVTYANVGHEFDSVVAIPSKMPSAELIQSLSVCDDLFVTLDPDAMLDGASHRISKLCGTRSHHVHLPAKVDDLFVDYGMSPASFMRYVEQVSS